MRSAILLLVTASIWAAPADQQAYARLMRKGIEELRAGKHEEAVETFKEMEGLFPDDPTAPYNIACGYSLMNKKAEALTYLRKAVDLGFLDLNHIQNDTDLDNIRKESGYQEALAALKKKAAEREAMLMAEAREEIRAALKKPEPVFPFDFDLKDITGKPLSLSGLAGKVVLVDLWGTWCPPCRRAIPHLIRLHKEYEKRGLVVVGLAFEHETGDAALKKVRDFVAAENLPYPCAVIEQDFLKKIPGFRGFPTTILVDRAGKARLLHVGYTDYGALAGWVEELLGPAKEKVKEKKIQRERWF